MKKWMNLRMVLGIVAVFGWWGLLYPELTMSPDTYAIIGEGTSVQTTGEVVKWEFDNDVYWAVLNADCDQIRLRSKLWTDIEAIIKKQ